MKITHGQQLMISYEKNISSAYLESFIANS